jgi:hypothetical protein
MFGQDNHKYKSYPDSKTSDWDSIDGLQLWRLYPHQPEAGKFSSRPTELKNLSHADVSENNSTQTSFRGDGVLMRNY